LLLFLGKKVEEEEEPEELDFVAGHVRIVGEEEEEHDQEEALFQSTLMQAKLKELLDDESKKIKMRDS